MRRMRLQVSWKESPEKVGGGWETYVNADNLVSSYFAAQGRNAALRTLALSDLIGGQ